MITHGPAQPRLVFMAVFLSLIAFRLTAQTFYPIDAGTTVNGFQDDFNGTTLGANWTITGANVYSVNNGLLHVANAVGDPNHLLYKLPGYNSTVQEVLARIRVTSFGSGSYPRAGIVVAADGATGHGINYTFRDVNVEGQIGRHMAFLDDFRAWGPGQNFVWQNNVWYWLRLRHEPNAVSQGGANDVFAKIWLADGTVPEPGTWQLVWNYNASSSTRSGYAGILANSTAGGGQDFAVFDVDYILIKASGLPSIVVSAGGFVQTPATIITGPQSQTVTEFAPVTFNVSVGGSPPPTFQWFRNGNAISGATNASYHIASAQVADNGAQFKVIVANVVSNSAHSATSTVATLTVIADTNPPVLLGARSFGSGLVHLFFSERITLATATNLAHYSLTGSNGIVMISDAALDATQTNLLLTVAALTDNAHYTLAVRDLRDVSTAGNVIANTTVNFTVLPPTIFITEFLAENTMGLIDQDGARPDWIELQNQSSFAVDLLGWHLTDNPLAPALWTFPSTTLQPGQFLIVFASGNDRRMPGGELHTNFRLDAGGEYLALVRPNGTVAQEFYFGKQRKDVSFGLSGGTNLFMLLPTPGMANSPGVLGFVADTKFTPGRGFFTNAFSLVITSATPGVEIWFTRDGEVPSPGAAGATRYTQPVLVSNTTTLRAAAFLTGYAPTDVDTHTFIFAGLTGSQPNNPPGFPSTWAGYGADYGMDQRIVTNTLPGYSISNALLSLPALSLVAPRDDLFGPTRGIYNNSSQTGRAWERETSVELIFPNGAPGFQCEAGLRIHGYSSRDHSFTLKHSFHINFRDIYGPAKLHFPLFPDTPVNDFDQIVLRACSTDSYPVSDINTSRWLARRATYIRDQWMRDALRDLGEPTSHGRYVHLWINGLYWGLYNVAELLGNAWAEEHLGGGKEEYDALKDYLIVDAGDQQAWDAATSLASAGFASEAEYQRIQGNNADGTRNANYPVYLNLTNLVDYFIVHITAGAEDWDFNNWWGCRRRGPESEGFRFVGWDQEISNESLTRESTAFSQRFEEVNHANRPSFFYERLRKTSASFRQLFMDRVWPALNGNGPLTPANNAARWLARQNEIDRAIVAETARWGDSRHEPPFTRQGNWLGEMQWVANYWTSNHTRVVERFRRVNLWPSLAPPAFSRNGGYFTNDVSLVLAHTNAGGTIRFTLDGTDPRPASGSPAATAQIYSTPIILTNATRVRARVTDGTNWSPPIDATFLPYQALTNLVVTEIYYNPSGGESVDGDAFEFIELQNRGSFALDLSRVSFTAGIQFTFTNGTFIAPNAFVVLVSDKTNFAARFSGVTTRGTYSGKLSNSGEQLALGDPIGGTIFNFDYDDITPWPLSADGYGPSLQRFDFTGEPGNATNWAAAVPTPGAPVAAFLDTDGDGLPDAWELPNGLDRNNPSGEDGAIGDADEDGLTNFQEYIAGTHPRDGSSFLKIKRLSVGEGSNVTLTFAAASNRTYTVQQTLALTTAWLNLTNIAARVTNHVQTIVVPAVTNGFYRLVTPGQP